MKARNGGKGMTDEQVEAYEPPVCPFGEMLTFQVVAASWIVIFQDMCSLGTASRMAMRSPAANANCRHGLDAACVFK